MTATMMEHSLAGKTLRWTFPGGPTGDTVYEHVFRLDGMVTFQSVGQGTPSKPIPYVSFEVGPHLHMVSYLSEAGHTLTVLANLKTGALRGFASNGTDWHPLVGEIRS